MDFNMNGHKVQNFIDSTNKNEKTEHIELYSTIVDKVLIINKSIRQQSEKLTQWAFPYCWKK